MPRDARQKKPKTTQKDRSFETNILSQHEKQELFLNKTNVSVDQDV